MSTITQFPSGNTQYRIEFDYLARTFVVVTLVNSSNPTLNRVLEVGRDYRFLNPTMIEMLADQSGFDIVRIHRQTGTDLVVDFRNGSVLTASDLTNAELQAIHIAEEGRDQTVDLAKEYADAAGTSAGNAKDSEDEARGIAASIKEAGRIGYITNRSFEKGFNVTAWNEVLLWEEDGEYYRWDGTLPKNAPAGSTPETSGGIGLGAWVSVGDASLRNQLNESDGFKLIGKCDDISTLRTIEPDVDGQRIFVEKHTTSIAPNESGDSGGGWFYADLADSTTNDDNGVVIITSGGNRWKRDLSDVRGITPKMFGAWMDAPYIDGSTIQGTPYPKAPSMGAADLFGTHDDGAAMLAAYTASIAHNIPLLIEQPIYIGTTQIDISLNRLAGKSLDLQGVKPRQSIIYTSGKGGFISTLWVHNLHVSNIAFRNADSEYSGCPLLISDPGTNGGGGKLFDINNVEFYHYKFAFPNTAFVSTINNLYAYDCTYGFAVAGSTSLDMGAIWAHHCKYGYLWGAAINRTTYTPEVPASGAPVMYVKATNIAADGCIKPHSFMGNIRSLDIDGLGIEGINGVDALDFSAYEGTDDTYKVVFRNVSCWIQSSMNTEVLRFITPPKNESRMPKGSIVLDSGYVKSDYTIQLINKVDGLNVDAYGNSFYFGEMFRFIKLTDDTAIHSNTLVKSSSVGGRVYGSAPLEGANSYNGVLMSSAAVNSEAYFRQVRTETASFILPWNRCVDILLTAVGEESRFEGGCFLAGEMSIIPVNKNGLGGKEAGGRLLFSISGSTEANVASGVLWSNKDAGDKSLAGITVSKRVAGGKTFIRVDTATASMSMAVVHMTLTYCGFSHYYDRRWEVKTI